MQHPEDDPKTPPAPPAPREVSWNLISDRPPLYYCGDLLAPEECEAVIRLVNTSCPRSLSQAGQAKVRVDLDANDHLLAPAEASVLRSVERRVAALSAVPMHDGEMPWAVHFTPGISSAGEDVCTSSDRQSRMSLGLHVDTNNCRERRWVTFIVYLHTTPPECGGHTVFPLALRRGASEPRAPAWRKLCRAGEILLGANVHHTGQAANPHLTDDVQEASRVLLGHAERVATHAAEPGARAAGAGAACWDRSGVGVAVSPVKGSCVAFFTRSAGSDGEIDPRSWHGGAAVIVDRPGGGEAGEPGADGKWTLQKFREAPAEALRSCCIKAFARQHSALYPGCGGGLRFEVDEPR